MTLSTDNYHLLLGLIDQADREQVMLINTTLHERHKTLIRREAREVGSKLQVGSRVRFKASTRPSYLAHQSARVVAFRQTKVTVELDNGPMGKFRSGKIITSPASLDVLSSDD